MLPTGEMRNIRSDFPENLTDMEIQWLVKNNITTIIDLLSDKEIVNKPCCLKEQNGFRYFHLPVTGGGDTPKSLEHLHVVYQNMLDGKMENSFYVHFLWNISRNSLLCHSKLLRTGLWRRFIRGDLCFDRGIYCLLFKIPERLSY